MGYFCNIKSSEIWRIIAAVAAVIMAAAFAIALQSDGSDGAKSGTCGDDLIWELDGGHLTISGSGPMYAYDSDYYSVHKPRWGTRITSVSFEGSAISIGDNAFLGCTSLASADLFPVESVGDSAFRNCISLKSVSMPSATSVGDRAFGNCTSLKSADLPSVTSIGYGTFADCTSLKSDPLAGLSAGKCGDDLEWRLDGSGNLTISGSGPMADYGNGGVPWGTDIKA